MIILAGSKVYIIRSSTYDSIDFLNIFQPTMHENRFSPKFRLILILIFVDVFYTQRHL